MRVLDEALDFAAEQQRALHLGVVKRLDAEEVARAEERFGVFIPDDERKHAAQLVQKAGAVFLEAVQ